MSVPLADAGSPSSWVVERLRSAKELRRELEALGLVPGTMVRILRRSRGSLLVQVGDARYSLGDEVARDVLVRRG